MRTNLFMSGLVTCAAIWVALLIQGKNITPIGWTASVSTMMFGLATFESSMQDIREGKDD